MWAGWFGGLFGLPPGQVIKSHELPLPTGIDHAYRAVPILADRNLCDTLKKLIQ